ncbi:MAG: anaerobic ribonucleoside-triphosphate reductase activating protein [Coriobacteriales bacterium]|jgi:anaerobic ribonucleoside-triphosphate reductase activating protein|nr:anaerobic ribonucleoside-triphosphate reductase activating protein [Coriobacteriales bacterium]
MTPTVELVRASESVPTGEHPVEPARAGELVPTVEHAGKSGVSLDIDLLDTIIVNLYGTVDDSIVDGPGIRFAIFTQGCRHACPGCHNPAAQPFAGGKQVSAAELWEKVEANPLLAGITLTGGEPFEQADALIALTRCVREKGLSTWAYSGYLYEELLAGVPNSAAPVLLKYVDVLVDGLFIESLRTLDLLWRGSSNQRLIDVAASLAAQRVIEWN